MPAKPESYMADDRKLVRRAKEGDDEAFEQLVTAHEARIYSIALRMTGNSEDAADLTQEAFVKIWKGIDSFNMDSSFSTWAYRLTTNVCIDFLRKSRKSKTVSITIADDEGEESDLPIPDERYSPEYVVERQGIRTAVSDAMDKLEPQYRQVLAMRELGGLSYDEIAGKLELKEGTVKSRLARAREKMRRLLIDSGNFSPRVSSDNLKGVMLHGQKL